jgi:hypothetical protein
MKAIKSLLAVSVLAAAGAANATVWDVTMTGTRYFDNAGGNIDFTYAGTYDDAVNTGSVTGDIFVEPYNLTVTTVSPFSMNPATGKGTLSAASSCDDHGSGTCSSFAAVFKGPIWNGINWGGTPQTSTATPFTVAEGTYNWGVIIVTGQDDDFNNIYDTIPLTVKLSAHQTTPAVPVPAAAWLFGSSLLGLAGAARRRITAQ